MLRHRGEAEASTSALWAYTPWPCQGPPLASRRVRVPCVCPCVRVCVVWRQRWINQRGRGTSDTNTIFGVPSRSAKSFRLLQLALLSLCCLAVLSLAHLYSSCTLQNAVQKTFLHVRKVGLSVGAFYRVLTKFLFNVDLEEMLFILQN